MGLGGYRFGDYWKLGLPLMLLFFVVAEVVPKTYAIQHTDRAALRSAGFLYGPVPATPEELHEPDVLAGLRRLRERVDPDRRFAALSRIAT